MASKDCSHGEYTNLMTDLESIDVEALNTSTRKLLARQLDPEASSFSNDGHVQDFQGLAELMGFDINDITWFKEKDKTISLLDAWQRKGRTSSIGQLWRLLDHLERKDVVKNEVIIARVNEDIVLHRKRKEEMLLGESFQKSCDYLSLSDTSSRDFDTGTVTDRIVNLPMKVDTFISFSDSNISFVKSLANMLKNEHKISVCIPGYNFSGKISAYEIAKQCKNILLIMSESYLQELESYFQVKYYFKIILSLDKICNRILCVCGEVQSTSIFLNWRFFFFNSQSIDSTIGT